MAKTAYLLLILLTAHYGGFSQETAVVDIFLQSTDEIKVERQVYFDKADNFRLTKIGEGHFRLQYLADKPGIIYVNYRPIFITPGDSVQLTHRMILRTAAIYRDTLIAKGRNAGNYVYSNFTERRRAADSNYPEIADKKYKGNATGLYNDLVNYFSIRSKYQDNSFSKIGSSKELVDFMKRKLRLDFLSNLVYFEEQIAKKYPDQLPEFSKKLESDFRSTVFIPSDTAYTRRMEEIFKNYLYHLVYIKCNGVETGKDFDNLISYIQAYPNPFMKEYLLCFLLTDYTGIWKKYKSPRAIGLVENINNSILIGELKKYFRSG